MRSLAVPMGVRTLGALVILLAAPLQTQMRAEKTDILPHRRSFANGRFGKTRPSPLGRLDAFAVGLSSVSCGFSSTRNTRSFERLRVDLRTFVLAPRSGCIGAVGGGLFDLRSLTFNQIAIPEAAMFGAITPAQTTSRQTRDRSQSRARLSCTSAQFRRHSSCRAVQPERRPQDSFPARRAR